MSHVEHQDRDSIRPIARLSRARAHVQAILGYVAVAIVFTWPLSAHLQTSLPGPPAGDAGVYVWNIWVFQHEVLDHRALPYFTDAIFSTTGQTNLSLHNYTAFADLLALPFVRVFGTVPTFNVIYLLLTVLTGYCMFLFANTVTSGERGASWLAGLLFAWSPVLVTRGFGHYSLVAAAPLPIFALLLMRARDGCSSRDAVAFGLVTAWATACDVYFGVYCVMAAGAFLVSRAFRVSARADATRAAAAFERGIETLACLAAVLVLVVLVSDGWDFTVAGHLVRMRTVYTPLLALTILVGVRVGLRFRLVLTGVTLRQVASIVRPMVIATIVYSIVMSPLLFAVAVRILHGRFVSPRIFWRSSPPGADLLAWVTPNPNHPLAPASLRSWVAHLTRDGYLENVVSIPFVALAVIAAAVRAGWRAPKFPLAIAIGFGVLAFGPFVRMAGVDTHIPAPWALLRYVPLIGLARSPSRFAIFAMVGVSAVFATALQALSAGREQHGGRRSGPVVLVAALLLFELLPAPRTLASARIPSVYTVIRADSRPGVRVLGLPFGITDGTRTIGRSSSLKQFYQTAHGKPIVGGYVSRVSRQRFAAIEGDPVLGALIRLSEGHPIPREQTQDFERRWHDFVRQFHIGYVVLDDSRTPDELRKVVTRSMNVEEIARDGSIHLYRPRVPDGWTVRADGTT